MGKRRKLVCDRGNACAQVTASKGAKGPMEFSTHSSNRTACHLCVPKCVEKHYFGNHILAVAYRKKMEAEAKAAEKAAEKAA